MRLKHPFLIASLRSLLTAALRFPLTLLSLVSLTSLSWYIIWLEKEPPLIYLKWVFILILGATIGLSAQFVSERFKGIKARFVTYGVGLVLLGIYAFLIWPSPEINYLVGTRTVVAVFVTLCVMLAAPSIKKGYDFNQVSLVHFKAAFTAGLYAMVLFLGLAAILTAIDLLLFRLDDNYMAYTATLVWIFFAVSYYSSLLPEFSSEDATKRAIAQEKSETPKLLKILISYIAIPLISVYTLVLFAYFLKIIFTQVWPIGQLGPMILGYSIAGFVLFILASNLNNRFASLFQTWFPRVLIPIVMVQLVSIGIRLNAYGVTESRYFLAIFGVYSLSMGLFLSLKNKGYNAWIAIIALIFALVSITPPLDAFSISRNSQRNRLENMLVEANMLKDGELIPNSEATLDLKVEVTSILEYMERRNYLSDLSWLDADFDLYFDFEDAFGFKMSYSQYWDEQNYFYAGVDFESELDIQNYDRLFRVNIYRDLPAKNIPNFKFTINEKTYQLTFTRLSDFDLKVELMDEANQVLLTSNLYMFVESLMKDTVEAKDLMAIEDMTLNLEANGARMRIIFQSINVNLEASEYAGSDYDLMILVDVDTLE